MVGFYIYKYQCHIRYFMLFYSTLYNNPYNPLLLLSSLPLKGRVNERGSFALAV